MIQWGTVEEKQFAGVQGIRMNLVLDLLKSLGESHPSEDVQDTVGYTNLEFKRTHMSRFRKC